MNRDIRLAVTFSTHRKRRKLQRLLGPEGVLAFIDLLLSAAQNRPDGRLGADPGDIALDASWAGDPDVLVAALEQVGFLDRDAEGFSIHGWQEHNAFAASAPERSARASQAAKARWSRPQAPEDGATTVSPSAASTTQPGSTVPVSGLPSVHARGNATGIHPHCPFFGPQAPGIAPSPSPSPSPPPDKKKAKTRPPARPSPVAPIAPTAPIAPIVPPHRPEDPDRLRQRLARQLLEAPHAQSNRSETPPGPPGHRVSQGPAHPGGA